MKKFLILTGGWLTFGSGVLLLPVPLPLPFPAGPVLLLVGSSILVPHSKTFRRGVMRVRYRFGWLSRGMDVVSNRSPTIVKSMVCPMVERTRPAALERHARLKAARAVA
ncbi:MAG: hypothetical protein ABSD74_07645 [Rhizomicrobium sp.]|jgi:hypothetical protein